MRRAVPIALSGLLMCAWLATPSQADLKGPRPEDRQITLAVTSLIRRDHLSGQKLDDEISNRIIKLYLDRNDPLKLYFEQSDVDEFMKRKDKLDDMLAAYDVSFGYDVFKKLLKRIDERVAMASEILDEEHDFSVEEVFRTEPEKFAKDKAAIRDRWRKRIKYDLLTMRADDVEGEEAKKRLRKRYSAFAKRMRQTDDDELMERFLSSVTMSFDPHTTYFSPSTLEDFRIRLALNYQGIGAELESEDGFAVIRRVMPGGAAEKAGELKAKDRIFSVGQGDDGEMVKVVDNKLGDIIELIRGKEGTVVRIGVIPKGEKDVKIYKITRARIQLDDSAAKGEVIELEQAAGKKLKVGVIDLPSFYLDMEAARLGGDNFKSTTRDVTAIIKDFKKQDVDVVLLDLRRNGGGSLSEAINLTGLFIDRGPVLQVKDNRGKIDEYKDRVPGMAWEGPLVVATSRLSASASEILAGAIKDYKRGLIVGDPSTHGKGTVQSLLELGPQIFRVENPRNLGALKITMQQFYRPNGESTQERGVPADIVVPSLTNSLSEGESQLDYAVAFDKIDATEFEDYGMLSKASLEKVRKASKGRRAKSEDFKKLLASIERFEARKERKSIPLNEKQFEEYRDSGSSDEEPKEEPTEDGGKKDEKRGFFLQELVDIAGDYFESLDGNVKAQVRD